MAEGVRGVEALQQELVKTKESLKDVDENIKKLTGRDPGDNRPGQRRVSTGGRGGLGVGERLFALSRRSLIEDGGPSPAKRRAIGGAFSRLGPRVGRPEAGRDSGDEEDLPNKPTIQSSVVATVKESRTRQDIVREQNKDEKGKARNRRMFGLLLGTLQRFQDEAKVKTDKEKQRKAIEQKLEEKAKMEKEEIKKERQQLFNRRRQNQAKLRRLEQKMELVQIHGKWEAETKRLMHFIRTKAKPHIFFLPKSSSGASDKKLRETRKVLENIIHERRKQLEEEIEELTKQDETHDGEHEEEMEFEEGNEVDEQVIEITDKKSPEKDPENKRIDDKENRTGEERRRSSDSRRRSDVERTEEEKDHSSDSDSEEDTKTKETSNENGDSGKRKRKRPSSEGAQSDQSDDNRDSEKEDKNGRDQDSSSDDEEGKDVDDKRNVVAADTMEDQSKIDERRIVVGEMKKEPMDE